MRRFLVVLLILIGFLPFLGWGVAHAASPLQSVKNVFVIVMENHSWSQIKNSSSAPYINGLLTRSDASFASNYHNVLSSEAGGNLHPSEPNYVWTEAATNSFSDHTFTNDNDASGSNSTSSTAHLVTNLTAKGLGWTGYMENKPSGCPISSSGGYAAKHNPFVYFQDVSGNPPSNGNAYCQAHTKDSSALASDISGNTLTPFSYIVPNLCNDMHDSCSPTNDAIKQGDNWLQSNLPTILNSPQYAAGGAVFITWDEDCCSSNNAIGMIVLSPFGRGNGYTNSIAYSHTSLAETIQNIFGLPSVGNTANSTPPDLSDLFQQAAPTPTPGITPTPSPPVPSPTPAPPGSITFRGATETDSGAGTTSLVLRTPAGTQTGDVLIAHIVVRTAGLTLTAPTGWALIRRLDSTTSISTAAYIHVAGAAEPGSYTWTFSASNQASGGISGYSGASPVVDASAAQYNSSVNNVNNPGVTTTQANDMLVYMVGIAIPTTVNTIPGFTQEWSVTSNSNTSSEMSEETDSLAGATGPLRTTHNGGLKSNVTILIALKSA